MIKLFQKWIFFHLEDFIAMHRLTVRNRRSSISLAHDAMRNLMKVWLLSLLSKLLGMLPIQLDVKRDGQEAAQSRFILAQSELIFLLRLAVLCHGITQWITAGRLWIEYFLSSMKKHRQGILVIWLTCFEILGWSIWKKRTSKYKNFYDNFLYIRFCFCNTFTYPSCLISPSKLPLLDFHNSIPAVLLMGEVYHYIHNNQSSGHQRHFIRKDSTFFSCLN